MPTAIRLAIAAPRSTTPAGRRRGPRDWRGLMSIPRRASIWSTIPTRRRPGRGCPSRSRGSCGPRRLLRRPCSRRWPRSRRSAVRPCCRHPARSWPARGFRLHRIRLSAPGAPALAGDFAGLRSDLLLDPAAGGGEFRFRKEISPDSAMLPAPAAPQAVAQAFAGLAQ